MKATYDFCLWQHSEEPRSPGELVPVAAPQPEADEGQAKAGSSRLVFAVFLGAAHCEESRQQSGGNLAVLGCRKQVSRLRPIFSSPNYMTFVQCHGEILRIRGWTIYKKSRP